MHLIRLAISSPVRTSARSPIRTADRREPRPGLQGGPAAWSLVLLAAAVPRVQVEDRNLADGSAGRPIRQWANKMANLYQSSRNARTVSDPLVDLTPGIFIQWNNIGLDTDINPYCIWDGPQYGWNLVDGSDWTYMIQTAGLNQAKMAERHLLKPNCGELVLRNPSNGISIVWTYSYNEWYEGSGVEELTTGSPTYPYPFGLQPLQLLKQKLP